MQKDDFTLQNINNNLHDRLKEQKNLNYCKMLAHAHEEDLSITAKHDPPDSFVTLSGDGSTISDGFYYGVSPRLDKQELVRCISNLELQNADGLNSYIANHGDWFMTHPAQEEYLPTLARYIVICMASHFGIRIKMEQQKYSEFDHFLTACGYSPESKKTILSYSKDQGQATHTEHPILTIKGCPSEKMISFLDRFKYKHLCKTDGNPIPLYDNETDEKTDDVIEAWEMLLPDTKSEKSKSIREIYADHLELIEGRVFYSGVLLKPTELEIISGSKENDKIQSLCIHFERSTYGTVCALDRNLTEHPLLKSIKPEIIKMLQYDDKLKRQLADQISKIENSVLEDSEASKQMLYAVSDYLKECINVNQIGVSANIVTNDGLMLLGQRSHGNIDDGQLYPGVNGNSEVADRNVSFYSLSVYEDYPTIQIDSDRNDFFGEISREAYGELKLNLPRNEWVCCGIIISGNMPNETTGADHYPESHRRFHFNIIFEQHTDKSFQEIEELSKKATEAFETKRYLGIRVDCEESRWKRCLKAIGNSVIGIVSHKDFIEAAVAIVLFLGTIKRTIAGETFNICTLYRNLIELSLTDFIALILSIIVIVGTGIRIYKDNKYYWRLYRERRVRRIHINYKKKSYTDLNNLVAEALRKQHNRKELYPLHPAAYACLRVFVDNIVLEAISPKDRR